MEQVEASDYSESDVINVSSPISTSGTVSTPFLMAKSPNPPHLQKFPKYTGYNSYPGYWTVTVMALSTVRGTSNHSLTSKPS